MKKLILFAFLLLSVCVNAQNSPQRFPPVQVLISPSAANWQYDLGDKANVTVQVLQYGVPLNGIKLDYELSDDLMAVDEKGSVIIKKKSVDLIVPSTQEAGFKNLKVVAAVDGEVYTAAVKLGFSIDKIEPKVKEPQDFDSFWSGVISKARKESLDPKIELLEEYSTKDISVYLLSIYTGIDNHRVSGYLCKPNDDKKHPVLFSPPGAGVKSIEPYLGFAKKGFISLSIEIHGLSPMLDKQTYKQLKLALDSYQTNGMSSKEDYYYKAVYAGCVRSVDYLCSLPEYNGKAVVTGGSQGGALAIVTAALNEKVDALASFYPALCDISAFTQGRAGGWPRLFKNEPATDAQVTTLAYYDVINFAKRIQVPGFYSTGFNDNTCCPTSVFAAFNQIQSEKEMCITPPTGHWRFQLSDDKSIQFLMHEAGLK